MASAFHWLFEAPPPILASADAARSVSSVPADALGMQARRCLVELKYRVFLLCVAATEDDLPCTTRAVHVQVVQITARAGLEKLKRRIVGATKYQCLVPIARHGLCFSLVVRGAAADIRLSGCSPQCQFCASGCSRHAGSTMPCRIEVQGLLVVVVVVVVRCCH